MLMCGAAGLEKDDDHEEEVARVVASRLDGLWFGRGACDRRNYPLRTGCPGMGWAAGSFTAVGSPGLTGPLQSVPRRLTQRTSAAGRRGTFTGICTLRARAN